MKLGVQLMPPLWFSATRIFLGSIFLFGLLVLQGSIKFPKYSDIKIIITIAIFQIALPTALIHSGLLFLGAGRSAFLVFTMPLWVAPLAYFFLKEKLNKVQLLGLILGLSGITILFNPIAFNFSDQSQLLGNGLMLLASFSFATAMILLRFNACSTQIIQLVPWQLFLGSIFLTLAAMFVEGFPNVEWSSSLLVILIYNGPIASGFCFWAYITISSGMPAMSTSVGSLGIPVIGVISSAFILNESLFLYEILGLVSILFGVFMVSIADFRKAQSTNLSE